MKLFKEYEIGPRTIIGGLILFFSAIYMASGIFIIFKANVSARWPSVEGRIVTSSVTEAHIGDEPTYFPYIAYTYEVGSDHLFNTKVSFASGEGERLNKAKKIIEKYPVGKVVKIFYNPAKPLDSVLEPGEVPRTWDRVAFALVFLVIGRLIYANPQKKILGSRLPVKNDQPPDFHIHVQIHFSFLFTCLWIFGGIILAHMFHFLQPMTGFVTMSIVILCGVIMEALWQRSWRIFRHNLESVMTVFMWMVVLRQCGVSGISFDIITFLIASTIVVFREHTSYVKTKPSLSYDEEHMGKNIIPDIMPTNSKITPLINQGKLMSPKTVFRRMMVYILCGAVLFLCFMILRKWAEDDGSTFLQPLYAWCAAIAFVLIILGIIFGVKNWKCEFCGSPLPIEPQTNEKNIMCSECGRLNEL